jgi:hypothetical protein
MADDKKPLPPRDPVTGQFLPTRVAGAVRDASAVRATPAEDLWTPWRALLGGRHAAERALPEVAVGPEPEVGPEPRTKTQYAADGTWAYTPEYRQWTQRVRAWRDWATQRDQQTRRAEAQAAWDRPTAVAQRAWAAQHPVLQLGADVVTAGATAPTFDPGLGDVGLSLIPALGATAAHVKRLQRALARGSFREAQALGMSPRVFAELARHPGFTGEVAASPEAVRSLAAAAESSPFGAAAERADRAARGKWLTESGAETVEGAEGAEGEEPGLPSASMVEPEPGATASPFSPSRMSDLYWATMRRVIASLPPGMK